MTLTALFIVLLTIKLKSCNVVPIMATNSVYCKKYKRGRKWFPTHSYGVLEILDTPSSRLCLFKYCVNISYRNLRTERAAVAPVGDVGNVTPPYFYNFFIV